MKSAAAKSEHQMQVLGVFVHGVLVGLHALGVVYNLRRKNKPETIIHAVAAGFSLVSTAKHLRKANEHESD